MTRNDVFYTGLIAVMAVACLFFMAGANCDGSWASFFEVASDRKTITNICVSVGIFSFFGLVMRLGRRPSEGRSSYRR